MCIYIYIYTHTIHIYIYDHICVCIDGCAFACTRVCVYLATMPTDPRGGGSSICAMNRKQINNVKTHWPTDIERREGGR